MTEAPTSPNGLPGELRALRDWLTLQGYAVDDRTQSARYPPGSPDRAGRLTNRIVSCTRGACTIRFVLDRGQWSVEIFGTAFDSPAYGPELWRAMLDPGEVYTRREMPLREQAVVVRALLPRIEAAIASEPDVETHLYRASQAWPYTPEALRQWGFRHVTAHSPVLEQLNASRERAKEGPRPASSYRPPIEVLQLWNWLDEQGFQREEYYSPLSFGNQIVNFTRASIIVHFECDRSLWSLRIWGEQLRDAYAVDIWWACLEGSAGISQPEDVGVIGSMRERADRMVVRDARWLKQALPAIEMAMRNPQTIEECLRRQQRDSMLRR